MEITGLAGLGLIAAALGVIAYVRYRSHETETLHKGAELARELRALAGDDPVRLAAVDEYETTLYQRLFFVSVVAPRARAAAWALLGASLAAFGFLATYRIDGLGAAVVGYGFAALGVVFTVTALILALSALYSAATTPRVSFADSYAD